MTKQALQVQVGKLAELDTLISSLGVTLPSPLQPLSLGNTTKGRCAVWVKRDDLIHPIISGNKWRKLQPTLKRIVANSNIASPTMLSFGGGYSNHLHALAYCCYRLNWKLVACIRGDYSHHLTPMLQDIVNWGAQIHWMSKLDYKRRQDNEFVASLKNTFDADIVIPEGGSQEDNVDGFVPFIEELPDHVDAIICPVASGGTMAGLLKAVHQTERHISVLGVAVLKGEGYLEELVSNLAGVPQSDMTIIHDYHFGGYAKCNNTLQSYCEHFSSSTGIPVEPVYSGKLFYAAKELTTSGLLEQYENIVLMHTGGLQGAR